MTLHHIPNLLPNRANEDSNIILEREMILKYRFQDYVHGSHRFFHQHQGYGSI